MIRIANINESLINDIVNSINRLVEYKKLFENTTIKNPFVDDKNGAPVFQYSDITAIKQTKSKLIIIDLLTEGIHTSDFLMQYPRDKFYILCSNGWWDTNYFNLGFNYYLLYYNYFLYDYSKRLVDYRTIDCFQDKEYKFDTNKSILFCSLIGSERQFRNFLVKTILEKVNNKNYILNYNGKELGLSSREDDIRYDFLNYNSYKNIYDYYNISSSIPIKIYNKCKFNLVVESTAYEQHEFHLTEKTIKALITGIPFIIVGSKGFLSELKAIGFKTYNDIWSEHYDTISDTADRVNEIIKLINYINQIEWNTELILKFEKNHSCGV
jgi:hypothetical protein